MAQRILVEGVDFTETLTMRATVALLGIPARKILNLVEEGKLVAWRKQPRGHRLFSRVQVMELVKPVTYEVTYNRVGRRRDLPPLQASAKSADELAEHIHKNVRPHLASRDVRVTVDLEAMRGGILCGWNNGGDFTIRVPDEAEGGAP